MSTAIPTAKSMTIAEYLAWERVAETKSEYVDGFLVPLNGEPPILPPDNDEAHGLIALNVAAELRSALRNTKCRVFGTGLRVSVPDSPRRHSPDALVICGPAEFDPNDATKMSVTNPALVVEVLSPSTTASDRGEKFRDYRAAPLFHTYLLAAQSSPTVEIYHRQADGSWRLDVYTGLDSVVELRVLGIHIPMTEIYAGVTFPDPPVL